MRGTSEERNMMHRQQRQSSTSLGSSSSWGSTANSSSSSSLSSSTSSVSSSCSSPSSEYSSPLTILSRRCPSYRSRTSTTSTSAASSFSRCSHSSGPSASSACPVLLSVLAWSVTLLLISSCIGIADAGVLIGHPLGKRSFMELQCKGIYDKSIFARLDRVCEDCYNLFREPQLHTLCRKGCFTSDYFKGCVEVLLLQDEMPQIKKWIKQLHGADPRF